MTSALHVGKEAKELMKALLHRDPAKRLGAGHKGYEELKECRDFFIIFARDFLGGGKINRWWFQIFLIFTLTWANDPI